MIFMHRSSAGVSGQEDPRFHERGRRAGELPGCRFLSDEPQKAEDTHPVIHFAADSGWTNDPNGMIYDGECYHLYFQYNPFDTAWNNMSWGHAVSKDMLSLEAGGFCDVPG